MSSPIKLIDKVVLINDGEAFEVEFIDPTGHAYAVETIEARHLIYEPVK